MKNRRQIDAPLFRLAVCLMAGMLLDARLPLSLPLLPLFIGTFAAALLLRQRALWQSVALMGCFVVMGMLLMDRQSPVPQDDTRKEYFQTQRRQLLQRYQDAGLEGDQLAVVAAMTLGERSALSRSLRDTYSRTGASHILALSGLHLGIIYALLSFFLPGRRFRTVSQMVVIVSIWVFTLLVGMSASVVRSALMVSLYALLSLGHRDRMSVNVLSFAAIVMLCCRPLALFDIGFQLSFLAVYHILVWVPLLDGLALAPFMQRHHWCRWIWGMTAVSLAAQLGTAPLVAYYFGQFSTCFLLTNFLVIPLATLILYLAAATLLFPPLAPVLSVVVGILNHFLSWLSALPYVSVSGLRLSAVQVLLIYIIIAAVHQICLMIPRNHQYR